MGGPGWWSRARGGGMNGRDETGGAKAARVAPEADESASAAPLDDSLQAYLLEIGRVALLTEEQERVLGEELRHGNIELGRALRSLHARIRWLLLRQDRSPVAEAAEAWAP